MLERKEFLGQGDGTISDDLPTPRIEEIARGEHRTEESTLAEIGGADFFGGPTHFVEEGNRNGVEYVLFSSDDLTRQVPAVGGWYSKQVPDVPCLFLRAHGAGNLTPIFSGFLPSLPPLCSAARSFGDACWPMFLPLSVCRRVRESSILRARRDLCRG